MLLLLALLALDGGDPLQVVAAAKLARTFDLSTYPADPALWIPALHRDVAALDPVLGFQSLSYQVTRAGKARRLTVTLRSPKGEYAHESAFGRTVDDEGPARLAVREFYQLFNKMLSDAGSGARMHVVAEGSRFGLVLLTATQAKAMRVAVDLSNEDFDSIGPAHIARALARYHALGLLDHLSASARADAERRIRAADVKRLNDALALLPDVVARQPFDGGGAPHPYVALLRDLTRVSHGQFAPTGASDSYGKPGPVRFSFRLNGRTYETTLQGDGKWIDLDCWKPIERALTEAALPGRFHALATRTPGSALHIYLTPTQHETLVKESLAELQPTAGTQAP